MPCGYLKSATFTFFTATKAPSVFHFIGQVCFQAAIVSILLYGCTTWTLTKRLEKRLDSNYTRILRAILNRSWRQHPTKQQLYGHLPPITKTIHLPKAMNDREMWWERVRDIRADGTTRWWWKHLPCMGVSGVSVKNTKSAWC